MSDAQSTLKTQLLGEIEGSWEALQAFLAGLTAEQMISRRDAAGWAVKDHLAHLVAWEQSIVGLFQGVPRHQGLGVEQELFDSGDFEAMNAAIHEERKHTSLGQVLAELEDTHGQLLALVKPLADKDLGRPAAEYFQGASPWEERRVADLIRDNTADHFREHLGWITTLHAAGG
jgi:hypothetical protein